MVWGKERAFFFRGTGLPTAVRKNQPLVPRSNLGGKECARTDPWFRGQTLLVPGHGGGGVALKVHVLMSYEELLHIRPWGPVRTQGLHSNSVAPSCVSFFFLGEWFEGWLPFRKSKRRMVPKPKLVCAQT